jgi:O-antigen/teichoic acid export membrane protein
VYKRIQPYSSKLKEILKGKLFKSLSVYTILGFSKKAFPFVLLPFLTRVLTPEDYGIMAMFAVVKSFFGPFVGLGTASSVERYYFDKKEINFQVYLSNVLLIVIATATFFGCLFLLFTDIISSYTEIPKSFLWIVIVVSLGVVFDKINLALLRVQFKSLYYAYISLLETALYFVLMIVFVFGFKLNWKADFYTQLLSYIFLGLLGVVMMIKSKMLPTKLSFNLNYTKQAFAFGLPMFIHTFGLFFVNMLDRLLLTNLVGLEATGIYSIGFKMGTIILFFVRAFNNAYVPWIYEKLKLNTVKSRLLAYKSTFYSCIFVACAGILLILILPLIYPILIGEEFSSSIYITKIIVFAQVFNAFYLLLMSYILFEKATKYVMYTTLSTSIISVFLNLWLIPVFAEMGAAYSLLVVYFIKFLLTGLFVYHMYNKKRLILNG